MSSSPSSPWPKDIADWCYGNDELDERPTERLVEQCCFTIIALFFPAHEGYTVSPLTYHADDAVRAADIGVQHSDIDGKKVPLLFLEIKGHETLGSASMRNKADDQMRKRFKDLRKGWGKRLTRLHTLGDSATPQPIYAISVVGWFMCAYAFVPSEDQVYPRPGAPRFTSVLLDETTPSSNWCVDLRTWEGANMLVSITNKARRLVEAMPLVPRLQLAPPTGDDLADALNDLNINGVHVDRHVSMIKTQESSDVEDDQFYFDDSIAGKANDPLGNESCKIIDPRTGEYLEDAPANRFRWMSLERQTRLAELRQIANEEKKEKEAKAKAAKDKAAQDRAAKGKGKGKGTKASGIQPVDSRGQKQQVLSPGIRTADGRVVPKFIFLLDKDASGSYTTVTPSKPPHETTSSDFRGAEDTSSPGPENSPTAMRLGQVAQTSLMPLRYNPKNPPPPPSKPSK